MKIHIFYVHCMGCIELYQQPSSAIPHEVVAWEQRDGLLDVGAVVEEDSSLFKSPSPPPLPHLVGGA